MAKPIIDEHHVARKCSRQKQVLVDGVFAGVAPSFFELRTERKERYLSCSWWEYFKEEERATATLNYLENKTGSLKKAQVIILNVGKMREIGIRTGKKIRVLNHGGRGDEPYSQISGLPLDNSDLELLKALSQEALAQCIEPVY